MWHSPIIQISETEQEFYASGLPKTLSGLSSLAVPELDDSPIASGEAAAWDDSLFREVGIPEISWKGKRR